MSEQTYTLDQAATELAHRQCRDEGHDLRLFDHRTRGGEHTPIDVHCDRCRRHWDIAMPGSGGVDLENL